MSTNSNQEHLRGQTTRSVSPSSPPRPYVDKGKGRERLLSEDQTAGKSSADPLAEFYAEARAAHDNNVSGADTGCCLIINTNAYEPEVVSVWRI